ncbi:hypothetical protein P43SY_001685 [Pythium insidiosum]|uniref:Uncharacterized protein n=1 Tax=Pythium insidiosum TaxID=114742 RepID=A0AAD5M297_PYTIN|nr:hypothetical protein P43SY_001685 [Pythium insidiosum]
MRHPAVVKKPNAPDDLPEIAHCFDFLHTIVGGSLESAEEIPTFTVFHDHVPTPSIKELALELQDVLVTLSLHEVQGDAALVKGVIHALVFHECTLGMSKRDFLDSDQLIGRVAILAEPDLTIEGLSKATTRAVLTLEHRSLAKCPAPNVGSDKQPEIFCTKNNFITDATPHRPKRRPPVAPWAPRHPLPEAGQSNAVAVEGVAAYFGLFLQASSNDASKNQNATTGGAPGAPNDGQDLTVFVQSLLEQMLEKSISDLMEQTNDDGANDKAAQAAATTSDVAATQKDKGESV